MYRAMVERHLAEAEEHVALGLVHIARQIVIIADMQCRGHDTDLARELLQTYRDMQKSHEADRNRIRQELIELGC